jgi:hypothetical protein
VSGEKDRQALIEQKLVRHVACSHLVVRAHQQRQHVVVTRRFAAMLFDDLQQHRLDAVASLACASLVEPPQRADHLHERIVDPHKKPERLGKACADATRFLRHIGAEERKADDTQCETHHLFTADDPVRCVPPFLDHVRCARDDLVAVVRQPCVMKPRLGQPSLTAMQLAFAGQQAFAQHGFGVAQAASLDEVPVVRDQHVLD